MLTMLTSRGRKVVVPIVALLMFAVFPMTTPGSVLAQGAPTVGAIIVDSYDCDTGELRFRASVTNLPYIPEGNGSLSADVSMQYAQGPLDSPYPTQQFNPPPELAPYTGYVNLGRIVPSSQSTQDTYPPSGPLVSIDLRVGVGDGINPGDTSRLTYTVDCEDDGNIVDQLIAVLVRILQDILAD